MVLYRICQEALNNIAKHARAGNVEIDVQHGQGALELHIRDDGRGFDSSQPPPPGHYGLSMMRERADSVGALLTITSQPGHGTELIIQWREVPKQENP